LTEQQASEASEAAAEGPGQDAPGELLTSEAGTAAVAAAKDLECSMLGGEALRQCGNAAAKYEEPADGVLVDRDEALGAELKSRAPALDRKAVTVTCCLDIGWCSAGRRSSGDSNGWSGGRRFGRVFWARGTKQCAFGCGRPADGGAANRRLGGQGGGGGKLDAPLVKRAAGLGSQRGSGRTLGQDAPGEPFASEAGTAAAAIEGAVIGASGDKLTLEDDEAAAEGPIQDVPGGPAVQRPGNLVNEVAAAAEV
jgi:hypothetical protein